MKTDRYGRSGRDPCSSRSKPENSATVSEVGRQSLEPSLSRVLSVNPVTRAAESMKGTESLKKYTHTHTHTSIAPTRN